MVGESVGQANAPRQNKTPTPPTLSNTLCGLTARNLGCIWDTCFSAIDKAISFNTSSNCGLSAGGVGTWSGG